MEVAEACRLLLLAAPAGVSWWLQGLSRPCLATSFTSLSLELYRRRCTAPKAATLEPGSTASPFPCFWSWSMRLSTSLKGLGVSGLAAAELPASAAWPGAHKRRPGGHLSPERLYVHRHRGAQRAQAACHSRRRSHRLRFLKRTSGTRELRSSGLELPQVGLHPGDDARKRAERDHLSA